MLVLLHIARHGLSAVLASRPCFSVVSWVHESLMADEEVASGESLRANVAYEGFFFGVGSTDTRLACIGEMQGEGKELA